MAKNLREWIGASEQEVALLASAWLGNEDVDWEKYFKVTNRFASGELRPSVALLAEQDFTLLNRAVRGSSNRADKMLSALKKICPQRHAALPKFKIFLTRLLRRG
jgi:hypothetical protein